MSTFRLITYLTLIKAAVNATMQHRLTTTGIMNSTREIIVNPGNYTYEKISHIEMLETLRKYYEYPIEIFNAVADGAYAGKHSTPISDKYEFLETNYK